MRLWQISCAGAWRAATHSLPQMLQVLALVGVLASLIGWFFGTQWWNPLYLPVVVVVFYLCSSRSSQCLSRTGS